MVPIESVRRLTNRFDLFQLVLELTGPNAPIDYIEFGVFRGDTIRRWVKDNQSSGSSFVGFD